MRRPWPTGGFRKKNKQKQTRYSVWPSGEYRNRYSGRLIMKIYALFIIPEKGIFEMKEFIKI
jgi:hypothetical protein